MTVNHTDAKKSGFHRKRLKGELFQKPEKLSSSYFFYFWIFWKNFFTILFGKLLCPWRRKKNDENRKRNTLNPGKSESPPSWSNCAKSAVTTTGFFGLILLLGTRALIWCMTRPPVVVGNPRSRIFGPGAGFRIFRNVGNGHKLGVFLMRTDRGVAQKLFKKRMVRIGLVVLKLGPKNGPRTGFQASNARLVNETWSDSKFSNCKRSVFQSSFRFWYEGGYEIRRERVENRDFVFFGKKFFRKSSFFSAIFEKVWIFFREHASLIFLATFVVARILNFGLQVGHPRRGVFGTFSCRTGGRIRTFFSTK